MQGRRYATGLDPLTDAGGPTAPSLAPDSISGLIDEIKKYFFGRELRVGSQTAGIGKQVIVPVELTPNGDETAMSFTLEYDATMLANPRVTLGEFALANSTLTFNINEPGRIGILIDSAESMTASAMPKELLTVTFDVIGDGEGTTEVKLTGSLAAIGISDADGNSLAARYRDGKVVVHRK